MHPISDGVNQSSTIEQALPVIRHDEARQGGPVPFPHQAAASLLRTTDVLGQLPEVCWT